MGIACRIIRNEDNSVQFVEAPNGSKSLLYDSILEQGLEGQDALNTWIVSTTPSFREEVIIPKINSHRNRIFNKLKAITPSNTELNLVIEGQEIPVNIQQLDYTITETTDGVTMFATTKVGNRDVNVGKIRLRPFQEGYVVKDSLLSDMQVYTDGKLDTAKNRGIGTEMYKNLVSNLVSMGIPVYSSSSPSPEAEGIWRKFSSAGITKMEGNRFVIDPMPSSLDQNGEPMIKDDGIGSITNLLHIKFQ